MNNEFERLSEQDHPDLLLPAINKLNSELDRRKDRLDTLERGRKVLAGMRRISALSLFASTFAVGTTLIVTEKVTDLPVNPVPVVSAVFGLSIINSIRKTHPISSRIKVDIAEEMSSLDEINKFHGIALDRALELGIPGFDRPDHRPS